MTYFTRLAKINHLIQKNDLWMLNQPTRFDYSDGEDSELFLKRVISEAEDISSQSLELETCYSDGGWVAEYHLSYKRANLLRGLDLSGVQNALEIGCGCGAITRYLGEQGIYLDSIEGAHRRAEIARLRCRDMDHVSIINANYNDLHLPEAAYDAIFIVGVIEYAGRFLPGEKSDEAAVIAILKQLRNALKEDGVLIVAIENKNGLKYWLGASEDHYGRPYVGLTDYWGLSGTRTYSYKEWLRLLQKSGMGAWRFQFPFPDYKTPQVVLDEKFIDTDEHAYSLLYRIRSRDYLRPWQSEADEFSLWRALHQSNRLKEFANSFLIVAGQDAAAIDAVLPFDFTYFSVGSRKPQYRTITCKEHHTDLIHKRYLWANETSAHGELTHKISTTSYIKGALLATIWLEALLASNVEQFSDLLLSYYRFIRQLSVDDANGSLLDALPANIVVDSMGQYHIIDQEWSSDNSVTPEYILFRALLWFGHDNQELIKLFCSSKNLHSLKDFVAYGFEALSISTTALLPGFIAQEEALQYEVSEQRNFRPVVQLIATPFTFASSEVRSMRLYWATNGQSFTEAQSSQVNYTFSGEKSSICIYFAFDKPVARIRLSPLVAPAEKKILLFEKITLVQRKGGDLKPAVLWQAQSPKEISKRALWNQFIVPSSEPESAFIVNGPDAAFDFNVTPSEQTGGKAPKIFALKLVLGREVSLRPSFVNERLDKLNEYMDYQTRRIECANNRYRQAVIDREHHKERFLEKADINLRLEAQLAHAKDQIKLNEIRYLAVMSELKAMRRFAERLSLAKFIKGAGHIMPGRYGWVAAGLDQYNRVGSNAADYELIKSSGLFDEDYYREYQPDLVPFGGDPLKHYLRVGGFSGLNPNRLFNNQYYLKQYPYLADEKTNPLVHYLNTGCREGRDPCYLFNTRYYLGRHAEMLENGANPLTHYLKRGGKEGLDPHPGFDTAYYYYQRPDAIDSRLTPLEHFFEHGEPNHVSPTPLFDWKYYLDKRPQLRPQLMDADISAFRHFIEFGYREGSDPSPLFDTQYYLGPDLNDIKYKVNPVAHYVEKGQFENRRPNYLFDPDYYEKQHPIKAQESFKDLFSHYIIKGENAGFHPHPLFDLSFYKSQMAKICRTPKNLLYHFLQGNSDSCFMTCPLLEPGFIHAQSPDYDAPERTNLINFYGQNRDSITQSPHPLFDVEHYRSMIEIEASKSINPLIHYLNEGCRQGLSTHPEFDPQYYGAQNLEPALEEGQSPIVHYIYYGAQRGLWPSPAIEQLAFKPQIRLALLINGPGFTCLSGRVVAMMSQLYPRWRATVMVRNPDDSNHYRYAKALAEDDRRIRWIETDDTDSASTLLNRILKESEDEWIVFLHERMFLQAHALLAFVRRLNADQNVALIHTGRNENDPECIPIEHPGPDSYVLSNRFFVGPLACFRRTAIDKMGGFATRHQSPYDARFLTDYLHQAPINSVAYISETLHYTMAKDPLHIAAGTSCVD